MDRKGFILDAIPIITLLFTVAIISVVGVSFFSALDKGLSNSTDTESARARSIAADVNNNIDWVLDFIVVMLMVSLPIGSMILAFFNNIPPFFFFASLGVVLLLVVFGAALAESWNNAQLDSEFSIQSARMPITSYIMSHYGVYSLLCIIIIMSGTYVKVRNMV